MMGMMMILWKLCRTGQAGDTVRVLERLVSNTLDRAHHLIEDGQSHIFQLASTMMKLMQMMMMATLPSWPASTSTPVVPASVCNSSCASEISHSWSLSGKNILGFTKKN